jgi:hypothetical protein
MSIRTTYTKKLEDGRIALRMAAVQIHGEYLIGEAIDCLAAYEALRRSPEELREILCAQEGCCPCCGNSERVEGARFCHICGAQLPEALISQSLDMQYSGTESRGGVENEPRETVCTGSHLVSAADAKEN